MVNPPFAAIGLVCQAEWGCHVVQWQASAILVDFEAVLLELGCKVYCYQCCNDIG